MAACDKEHGAVEKSHYLFTPDNVHKLQRCETIIITITVMKTNTAYKYLICICIHCRIITFKRSQRHLGHGFAPAYPTFSCALTLYRPRLVFKSRPSLSNCWSIENSSWPPPKTIAIYVL